MAMMTTIRTVCIFDCPEAKIDLLQVGEAYITAHHHIHTDNGWMTACQAANRGLRKLWINQACNRVYSLSLNQGSNILVNTTSQLQHSPTHLVAGTMGCCLEPTSAPQHKGSLTYPHSHLAKLEQIRGMDTGRKHFGHNEVTTELNGELCFRNNRDREEAGPRTQEDKQQTTPGSTFGLSTYGTETQQWVNLPKPANSSHATSCPSDVDPLVSLETKSHVTHPLSETTTLLDTQLRTPMCVGSKLDAVVEDDEEEDMCEFNARLACLRDASCSGCKFCQLPEKQHLCNAYDVNVCSPATPEPTDSLSVIKKDSMKKIEHTSQELFQDHDVEIQLCTPKGEKVLWEEVKWVRNPYSLVCHDSTDLPGVAPRHYHLQATPTAELLCARMQPSLHSQFYKSAPKIATKEPGYSLGRNRVTRNQARSATHLKALDATASFIVHSGSSGQTQRPTRPTALPTAQNQGRN